MSSELIKHVTDATFDADVLQSDKPVLVDYWAEWCGPCKMIAPVLDELSKTYEGRLQIAKLNVDENRTIPMNGDGTFTDVSRASDLFRSRSVGVISVV